MFDLRVGDAFEIKLGRKQIRLVSVGGLDEQGEELVLPSNLYSGTPLIFMEK